MMLDPQRNLLTVLLVGALGLLGLIALILFIVFGRVNAERIGANAAGNIEQVQVDVPETGLDEFERYSAIMERPVFFSDRRLPVVELAEEGNLDEVDDEPEAFEDVSDLNAMVAGIVITPEMKLAMVKDQAADKTVVLREGMSLEGEQAAWRIDNIRPRMVSFVSVDGRQTDLELKVHTSGLTVGTPAPARRQARAQQSSGDDDEPAAEAGAEQTSEAEQLSEAARARAEEIRRRVAERRAELRAEAERRARQQQSRDNNG